MTSRDIERDDEAFEQHVRNPPWGEDEADTATMLRGLEAEVADLRSLVTPPARQWDIPQPVARLLHRDLKEVEQASEAAESTLRTLRRTVNAALLSLTMPDWRGDAHDEEGQYVCPNCDRRSQPEWERDPCQHCGWNEGKLVFNPRSRPEE